jgi:hypothetical protein
MDFRKRQSVHMIHGPQVSHAAAIHPPGSATPRNETAPKRISTKRSRSGKRSSTSASAKKSKQEPHPILNITTLPSNIIIPETEQRHHQLCWSGKTGGRRCAVCTKYPTPMNKGAPSRNLTCKWECLGCTGTSSKSGKNLLFMHEQCYLWHPPHRGFSQVWKSADEQAERGSE